MRIGDMAQRGMLLGLVQDVQSRVADSQVQATTGQKTQTFSGLAPDASRLLSLEDAREKFSRYVDNTNLAETRASLIDVNLERMTGIAREMRGLLETQPGQYTTLAQLARNYLKEFADLLNQSDGTRALFAGTNTTGPAVTIYEPGTADPAAPFTGVAVPITFDSHRYKFFSTGLATDTAIKVSDTLSVTVQINANPIAPAVANAFTRALDALIRVADFGTAVNPAPTAANVATAVTELTEAIDGVPGTLTGLDGLRTQLSVDRKAMQGVVESHKRFLHFTVDNVDNIRRVDMAEVATRLKSQQVQLETSYAALARIEAASLLDFLR
jgi:flagellar hook-associated protein 3 FlgL